MRIKGWEEKDSVFHGAKIFLIDVSKGMEEKILL
jgi:hypothetical protein